MDIKLHPSQHEIASDKHRYKVICAGRRWGKSVLSRAIMLKWAAEEAGLYWIVSPTYQQGKDVHWNQGFKVELPERIVQKWNDTDLSVTLTNGSVIQLKTAEHPDRLRGVKLRGLIVDEIAAMRNWNSIWKEALRPTLTDYKAPAIFISTPQGFNHFYNLFNEEKKTDTFRSWRFTSYDNPYIPSEEIDDAKKEYTNANGEVLDSFYQEYMADFRKHTGLVYKEFEREYHVIPAFDIPSNWSLIRGMDFGSTNPTAVVWIAIDPDNNWYVVDEHYENEQTIDYHAGIINSNPLSSRVSMTYGDPSGGQWLTEYSQRGIYITKALKERDTKFGKWVTYGIEKLKEKMHVIPGRVVARIAGRDKNPKFFVFDECINVIREFETYRWKEKVTSREDINEPDVPEKANDHALDAVRYCVVSHGNISQNKNYDFPDEKLFNKEGFY